MSEYSGELISELGVVRYLNGRSAMSTSNISFFDRSDTLAKKWQECNFGCHTPAYRMLKKPASWGDVLLELDKISPVVSGIADGIKYETVDQPARLAAGIERTAEGLHLKGAEKFSLVGEENWATYGLLKSTFVAMVEFDLSVLENPIMRSVLVIVNDYISVLPEWVLFEVQEAGMLSDSGNVDGVTLLKVARLLLEDGVSEEHLKQANDFVSGKAQRFIGKQAGKKIARKLVAAIALALATKITKQMLINADKDYQLRRQLTKIRAMGRQAGGSLGGALVTLLKSQGFLGTAAKHSRELKQKCPTTWHTLRYKLQGCDMVYFLVQPLLGEYVDRLSLLERQPVEFLKVMRALIESRNTREIFYPGSV
ncbi:cellulose-binding protein [Simiduia curdlanivorans]|uniref:Cellulose-binding protein n=1 Tax=Simiduia curdlanivorans TaxID=1492769 RepID=A0ABV8V8H1_9GAMM|nr:cellulose-binding protein [Simiduia curdlanivorans]MDN3638775.1 cellulose-binding protein [Simiduia curdlanivorans]